MNKLSQVPESHFGKPLKIQVKLILNCPRAHAITYTNHLLTSLTQLTTGVLIGVLIEDLLLILRIKSDTITGDHASCDESLKFDHSLEYYTTIP